MRAWLLAVGSGFVLALALPQAIPWISLQPIDPAGHLELLAWVGLVPALFALDRATTWKRAAATGLVAGLAYFYAAIWWVNHAMTAFGDVPFAVALVGLTLLVLYMAAHWALAFTVSWTIRERLGWPWWAHLPAVWTATELLRNYLFTGFPWANLGYLQARHLAVAQLAAATGIYGIAALVVLVNCTLFSVLSALLARRRLPWRLAGATAALVAAVVVLGMRHLEEVRARAAAAPTLRVALVQGNVNQAEKNEGRRIAGGPTSSPGRRRRTRSTSRPTCSTSGRRGAACRSCSTRTCCSGPLPTPSAGARAVSGRSRARTACSCSAPT